MGGCGGEQTQTALEPSSAGHELSQLCTSRCSSPTHHVCTCRCKAGGSLGRLCRRRSALRDCCNFRHRASAARFCSSG